ncbi:MAG: ATP-binding protein [Firmicutes bacterium]|nr:ATP-binding protein [Bacillota bacterium]
MITIERARQSLEALGLAQAVAVLESRLETAAAREMTYADFLADLLDAELAARRERYLKVRVRLAHLPFHKTVDQFDFGFQPSIDGRQIWELATMALVANATNVLFLGPPGVGKTHLAVALGLAAIEQGLAVYFVTAHTLVQDLRRAHAENRLERRLRVYTAPKLLVIDELGYLTMDSLEATLFFQLISARYTRGSIVLTSNKSFGDWGQIFGDTVIATAILDRLLHHSVVVNIRGESYRLREKKRAGLLAPYSPALACEGQPQQNEGESGIGRMLAKASPVPDCLSQ